MIYGSVLVEHFNINIILKISNLNFILFNLMNNYYLLLNIKYHLIIIIIYFFILYKLEIYYI